MVVPSDGKQETPKKAKTENLETADDGQQKEGVPDENHAVSHTTSTSKAKKGKRDRPNSLSLGPRSQAKRVKTAKLELVTKDTSSFKKNDSASVNQVSDDLERADARNRCAIDGIRPNVSSTRRSKVANLRQKIEEWGLSLTKRQSDHCNLTQ